MKPRQFEDYFTEWILSNRAFSAIVNKFGNPQNDIVASRANKKLQNYISWKLELDLVAIDVFSVALNSHIFSLFSLICQVLDKIPKESNNAIVTTPLCQSRVGFQLQ